MERIKVVNEDGEIGTVPADKLGDVSSLGFRELTPEVEKELSAKKFAQESPFLAIGAAALRGLTLGGSDIALTNLGLTKPETLKALKEENPTLSTIGEVAGNIAPAFATGGESLLAKGVSAIGAPARLAMEAGEGVARSVGEKLAAEQALKGVSGNVIKDTLKDAAIGAAKYGASGIAEGSIYGAAQAIDESALDNTNLSAENLVKGAGYGAVFGGGIGAGLGATGHAIKSTLDSAVNFAREKNFASYIRGRKDLPEIEKQALIEKYKVSKDGKETLGGRFPGVNENTLSVIESPELKERLDVGMKGGADNDEIAKLREETGAHADESLGYNQKSEDEAGKEVLNIIQEEFGPKYEHLNNEYHEIRGELNPMPVKGKDLANFRKLVEDKKIAKSLVGEGEDIFKRELDKLVVTKDVPTRNIDDMLMGVEREESHASSIKNHEDIYNKSQELRAAADGYWVSNPKLAHALKDLSTFMEGHFDDIAAKNGKPELRERLRLARKGWHEGSNDLQKLSDIVGVQHTKSISSIKKLDEAIEAFKVNPVKVIRKVRGLTNPDQIKYLAKKYPAFYEEWKNEIKNSIAKSAMDLNTKVFDPSVAYRKINDFIVKKPELAELALSKQQISDMEKYAKIRAGLKTRSGYIKEDVGLKEIVGVLGAALVNPKAGLGMLAYAKYGPRIEQNLSKMMSQGKHAFIDEMAGTYAKATSNIVDNNIKQERKVIRAARGFVDALKKGSNFTRTGAIRESVHLVPFTKDELEKSEQVYRDLQRDPMKMVEAFQQRNPELNQAMPNVAQATAQVITRAVEYLQGKIPQQRSDYFRQEYNPSKSEIFKFSEFSEAVFDPDKVLEKMKSGYISPRQLEALDHVYPETVAKLKQHVVDALPKADISEKGKNFIQLVLGVKAKPSLEPENIGVLQSSFELVNQKEMGGQNPGAKKPKLSNNIANQTSLDDDKAIYRRSLD